MLALQCVLCNAAADRQALCAACYDDIHLLQLPNPCRRCGLPQAAPLCAGCHTAAPPLAELYVHYKYEAPLSFMVRQFKYGGGWQLAVTLAQFLPPPPPADIVVPVPLHPLRERWRGFNQAHELAKKLDLQPASGLLKRIINTPPQVELAGSKARRKNIRGAFAADSAVRNKSVLLVDDVMTSGATLHEAARTLLAAGATKVSALLIARTVL